MSAQAGDAGTRQKGTREGAVMVTPVTCRAARAALGWSVERLARAAGLGYATVDRFERENAPYGVRPETALRIQRALEEAGVVFLDARTVRLPDGLEWPGSLKQPRRRRR